ncbi:hemolysin III family protein [uncultured Cellulomonas sp.]|uniref:PAQR family membrane homeostasis protein TrhA n=1 Tax=uncultured Cellulomonas sp. TaxID=189682 RepID=UPI00262AB9A0|nr:hemolysin III family protein [uncultured Cellulomonas sp.]
MAPPSPDRPDGSLGDDLLDGVADLAEAVKPRLRGWIHLGMTPVAVLAGAVLVALAPTSPARWTTAVFALTSVMLFGTSAVYHRGTWSPRVAGVLRRLDHSNIFLIIAGTYTPLAVLLLPPSTARVLLWTVWVGAVLGLTGRVLWLGAPRWLYTPIYVALGSVALGFLPQFSRSGGTDVVALVVAGGVAYIAGAVVYGTKRPNPSPRWFGFHEVFHLLTVVGFGCHWAAVWLAAVRSE